MRGLSMTFVNRLAGTMAGMLVFFASVTAWAAAGQPEPWQLGLQDAATPVAEFIAWLHNFLLVIITVITLFVLGLMLYIMLRFNAKANPVPSKNTHNTLLEVAWTVIPILILVAIAIPSLRLLYLQRDIPVADMTVKVIGNPSWNWTYEYPDLGLNDDGSAKVTFTSYLKPKADAERDNVPYLLATDVPVVVPVNKTVKLIVTSDPEGIIHAWTIPSFGMKIDAIPGRLNEDWFRATQEGVFYGQCSELCGKDHAFMPIEVHVVSDADFAAWSQKAQTASIEEARDFLVAMLKAKGQLAQN
ncbi:MAG: cytochrome c oxidase subunit II [Hyphomicrobiales bacterium]|nr:cytochrome c oxidase subunit II [Hyphomicrobiales bacterium]MBP9174478.1 cytochrome c oxidase subunit II [Hyphomicrobiales bacterium]MCC7480221.1 cytochrome c oxidase subunit II [Hyphomicrobiales bacterium]